MRSTLRLSSPTPSALRRLLVGGASSLLCLLGVLSPVAAHGNSSSNLDAQVFDVAPERAEFVYSGDVDRSSARGSLRYLGEGPLDAEDYFRFDVPTVELVPVGEAGVGPEFAFVLPRLAAGSYALDWEITPVGDHLTSSMVLFEVTVGVEDPDPVPGTPAASTAADGGSGAAPGLLVAAVLGVVLAAASWLAVTRVRRGRK
jgi:hypothetical protein